MFKKILIFIFIITLIFIISGCKKGEEVETDKIPQEGTYVRCVEVEEKNTYNSQSDSIWEYYDEDDLIEDSDLIFKGTVLDVKEIAIEEYINGRLNHIYYEDVFTFEVEKKYYSEDSSLEIGDVIKVANASSPSDWTEGTLRMEKGKTYIVLAEKSEDTLTIEFTKYDDYYTADHYASIIPLEDGKYYVDELFPSLTDNAEEEIIREDFEFETTVYVKGEELEQELEELILEKKGES